MRHLVDPTFGPEGPCLQSLFLLQVWGLAEKNNSRKLLVPTLFRPSTKCLHVLRRNRPGMRLWFEEGILREAFLERAEQGHR
mmetsp:Transcript_63013/g.137652  ORF Transcript_63013/g.137652 Transcript_63013/m.137652 type:complete len:82 (+) Transcript_63013:77-322(+)